MYFGHDCNTTQSTIFDYISHVSLSNIVLREHGLHVECVHSKCAGNMR